MTRDNNSNTDADTISLLATLLAKAEYTTDAIDNLRKDYAERHRDLSLHIKEINSKVDLRIEKVEQCIIALQGLPERVVSLERAVTGHTQQITNLETTNKLDTEKEETKKWKQIMWLTVATLIGGGGAAGVQRLITALGISP